MLRVPFGRTSWVVRSAPEPLPAAWGFSFLARYRCPIKTAKIATKIIKSIGVRLMASLLHSPRIQYRAELRLVEVFDQVADQGNQEQVNEGQGHKLSFD